MDPDLMTRALEMERRAERAEAEVARLRAALVAWVEEQREHWHGAETNLYNIAREFADKNASPTGEGAL